MLGTTAVRRESSSRGLTATGRNSGDAEVASPPATLKRNGSRVSEKIEHQPEQPERFWCGYQPV